jgi:ABC-2 type transport system ATP-binding protein
MIEVKNLTKKYGDKIGIEDVSFRVEKGEILGFLGPNGAGKTTTMRIITGFLAPTSGSANVCGYDVSENPMEVKRRTGYLPEQPPLYLDMSVYSYLDFVAKIKGVNRSDRRRVIDEVIEKCGLKDVRGRLIKNLSKGYRQRVGIAQAIVHNPEVLVLDEPTLGLDPQQIMEIRNFIKSLKGQHTIILSTHILPEVTMVCTRVLIINKGKLVAEDALEDLYKKEREKLILSLRIEGEKEAVLKLLKPLKGVQSVEARNGEILVECSKGDDPRDEILRAVVSSGMKLLEMKENLPTLEEIYIKRISQEG